MKPTQSIRGRTDSATEQANLNLDQRERDQTQPSVHQASRALDKWEIADKLARLTPTDEELSLMTPAQQWRLGTAHFNAGMTDTGCKMLELAARGGEIDGAFYLDSNTQLKLAWQFLAGDGVEKNPAHALSCFMLAAKNFDPDVAFQIGSMLENGQGCKPDARKALGWYEKAAYFQHKAAQQAIERLEGLDKIPAGATERQ